MSKRSIKTNCMLLFFLMCVFLLSACSTITIVDDNKSPFESATIPKDAPSSNVPAIPPKQTTVESTIVCPKITQPVCASKKLENTTVIRKTFANICEARNSEFKFEKFGLCSMSDATFNEATSTCPKRIGIVCGVDGLTYYNDCYAKKSGIDVQYYGDCRSNQTLVPKLQGTTCDNTRSYVCGLGNKTYQNDCYAAYFNASIFKKSKCVPFVNSTCANSGFVCGADGKSYGGDCIATTLGVNVVKKGLC